MAFTPSPQQQAFFDWIDNGSGNLILEAVAGAGKTTTLLEGTRRMHGTVLFMAYGNAAAKDIRTKADEKGYARSDMRISTVHSACYGAWRYANPKVQVEDAKVYQIMDAIAEKDPTAAKAFETCRATVKKLVSLGKAFLMGVPDMSNPTLTRQRDVRNFKVWAKIADRYSLFDDLPEGTDEQAVLDLTVEVFEKSAAMCRTIIDFDDQIYAPLRFNAKFFKNDWVLGDEWQDANPARREAVRRMLKSNGRAIFVGDLCQDIFGFTGTGNDSLGRTKAEFNCTEMPLTVTFRCPVDVVQYAHQWVSHIQAHENAPKGLVAPVRFDATAKTKEGKVLPWYLQQKFEKTDAILCRYNRPLVDAAFGLLRAGVACQVEGRDIGKNLITHQRASDRSSSLADTQRPKN